MILNRADLAACLGVHKTTVDNYVREGMPYKSRPDRSRPGETQWKFSTAECVKWLVDRAKSDGVGVDDKGDSDSKIEAQARARERMAIAGLREMEYAEKLKLMVHVEDVAERVETEYAIIKSRLQAIPGRVAQELAVTTDANAVERKLKEEVAECLSELSGDTTEWGA